METVKSYEDKGRSIVSKYFRSHFKDCKITETNINDINDLYIENDNIILIVEIKHRSVKYDSMLLEYPKYKNLIKLKDKLKAENPNKTIEIAYMFTHNDNTIYTSMLNDIPATEFGIELHQKTECFSQTKISKYITYLKNFKIIK